MQFFQKQYNSLTVYIKPTKHLKIKVQKYISKIKATVKSQALFLNARLRHSQCDILILKEQPLSSMAPATSYTQKGTSKQAEAEFSSY